MHLKPTIVLLLYKSTVKINQNVATPGVEHACTRFCIRVDDIDLSRRAERAGPVLCFLLPHSGGGGNTGPARVGTRYRHCMACSNSGSTADSVNWYACCC